MEGAGRPSPGQPRICRTRGRGPRRAGAGLPAARSVLAPAGAVPSSHKAGARRPWPRPRPWDAGPLGTGAPAAPLPSFTPTLIILHLSPAHLSAPHPTCGPPSALPGPSQWGRCRGVCEQGPRPARCRGVTAAAVWGGARSPLLSPAPHVQGSGPLPGSGAVQASHVKSSLGSEGRPTPATLLAAILNSYKAPSVKPSTCPGCVHVNTQNISHVTSGPLGARGTSDSEEEEGSRD